MQRPETGIETDPVVVHKTGMFPDGYFPSDALQYLKLEFESRLRRRPHYSLRAFARDLQMSPAALSDFMGGKAGLSGERALDVAKRLLLSADHAAHFRDLVLAKHSRSKEERAASGLRARNRVQLKSSELALDRFQMISEWYHLAILELVDLDPRHHSEAALAKALGVKKSLIKEAAARLERLELLVREGKTWRTSSPSTTVGNQVTPSAAIRSFHAQVLERAASALETQDISQRNFETAFFAVRRDDVPEIKAELQRKFKEVMKKYSQRGDKNALYCLGGQFFRLDEGVEVP